MTPSESPWTRKYWELVGHREILLQKRKDGEFDKQEWNTLIEDMEAHGMWSMANDLRKEIEG